MLCAQISDLFSIGIWQTFDKFCVFQFYNIGNMLERMEKEKLYIYHIYYILYIYITVPFDDIISWLVHLKNNES